MSQTRETILQRENSVFTPVRPRRSSNPRILFTQKGQSQEHRKENSRIGVWKCDISLIEEEPDHNMS